jgi:hypothetical protein
MRNKIIAIVFALSLSGCSQFTKANVRYAEEATRAACIIAHAFMPTAEVAKACQLSPQFFSMIERIASQHRAGIVGACK